VGAWLGLAAAFVLASLMWLPYGTLPGALGGLVSPHVRTLGQTLHEEDSIAAVAQLAQYVLVITGLLWYRGHRGVTSPGGAIS
jgi:hypothetical protein